MDKAMFTEGFLYFLEEFGQPFTSTPVEEATLNKYRGVLPDRLLEYWQEYGFCGFKNGLLWFTNPDDYADILQQWLPEEELKQHQFYVIARSGFGELIVWEPTYGNKYEIDPIMGWVVVGNDLHSKDIAQGRADSALQSVIVHQDPEFLDKEDSDDEPLFDRSVEIYGALQANEMFTFSPFSFMSERRMLENVRKVDLFVHFDIVRQMKEPELLDDKGLLNIGWGA